MKLEIAQIIAKTWVDWLAPACERVEIAGSVRREKPEVHDIEICLIPKSGVINPLEMKLVELAETRDFSFIKNGPKYKQLSLSDRINLDLFIVTPPAEWGVIFAIRTGPADFSHWIVTKKQQGGALPSDCQVKDGAVWRGGKIITMPEESDFFDLLGFGFIQPQFRWVPG